MKHILKNAIFLIVALNLIACSTENLCRRYFNIKNNSDKPIYYGLSYSQTDTSLENIEFVPGVNGNISHKIEPKGHNFGSVGSSKMEVFIFDADIVEHTPWDTIVKYNMVLKTYKFTRSDLEKMNCEIIYDGK